MYTVYCIYSSETHDPCYIGITKNCIHKRLASHKCDGGRANWIGRLYKKGHTLYVRTIETDVQPEDRYNAERYWIKKFAQHFNLENHFHDPHNTGRYTKGVIRDAQINC